MKITHVAVGVLRVPVDRSYVAGGRTVDANWHVLARIATSDGVEGIGYVVYPRPDLMTTIGHAARELGEHLIGMSVLEPEAAWDRLARRGDWVGPGGLLHCALAPLDIALWDAAGKTLGHPLHRLLGGSRDRVPAYASDGLWYSLSADELAASAKRHVEGGFGAVKLRLGKEATPEPDGDGPPSGGRPGDRLAAGRNMTLSTGGAAGDRFVIEGGYPIGGSMTASGNKNEALPLLAASLLVPAPVHVENVPRIQDVETLVQIMRGLGVGVEFSADHAVECDASTVADFHPDAALASEIRGSFLLAAPLLARLGEAVLPRPGGDKIGRRRLDTHLLALRQLGAEPADGEGYHLVLDGRFRGTEVFLDEASVTATETAIMAAATAEGVSRILNAASEPHVQGLCHALNAMGARIAGIGSNMLEIEGVRSLHGARHRLSPDHIEVGSFVAIAAMTGGELRVREVVPDHLRMIRLVFTRLGVDTVIDGTTLVVPAGQKPAIVPDAGGAIPKIDDAPWPAFPADLTPLALVLATQCEGTVLIHEKLFESRLFFVDSLIAMGARVVLCDPHRAVTIGPSPLHGATIVSPDIRAGMALIAAALCAEGRSTIHNVWQVDRGYERIDERLVALGARLVRERASA